MNWGVNDWVAVVSALLALLSLALNWLVVRRQTALQFETLKAEMDAEVFAWAHEAIDLVSHAVALARGSSFYPPDEFRRLVLQTEHRLSAVADRGRLFFPNEHPGRIGTEKEGAFQGFRPPILDAIVFASCQVERMTKQQEESLEPAADFLIKCRRLLVSEAQNAVDPRRRGAMLRRLAIGRMDDTKSNFDVAYELGKAFDARYPDLPVMRVWLAAQAQLRARA